MWNKIGLISIFISKFLYWFGMTNILFCFLMIMFGFYSFVYCIIILMLHFGIIFRFKYPTNLWLMLVPWGYLIVIISAFIYVFIFADLLLQNESDDRSVQLLESFGVCVCITIFLVTIFMVLDVIRIKKMKEINQDVRKYVIANGYD